jgi:hypothetical protein
MCSPSLAQAAITFRAAALLPPIVLPPAPIWIPCTPMPWPTVPDMSVPMWLASIRLPPAPEVRMPSLSKLWIAKPRTVQPPAWIWSPSAAVSSEPSSSMRGVPL